MTVCALTILLQWLRRVWPGSRDVTATSQRRGGIHGGRYVTLERGVGRVDVIMTSSGSIYESKLVVDDVRAADAGMYICSLSTAAGHISSTHAYLNVYIGTYISASLVIASKGLASRAPAGMVKEEVTCSLEKIV